MFWAQRSTLVGGLLCLLACGGTHGLDTAAAAATQTGGCSYTLSLRRGSGCSADIDPPSGDDEVLTELQNTVNALQQRVSGLQQEVSTLRQQSGGGGGAVYTRWGRTVCSDSSSLVYTGYAAGSHYVHVGGSSEILCLPEEPQWGRYVDGFQGGSLVYGSEYQMGQVYTDDGVFLSTNAGGQSLYEHDVPCAVCYISGRSTVKTFPAMVQCPDGWSTEYNGYLMAGHHTHNTTIKPVCLDEAPEITASGSTDQNGALLYNMEAVCGSLPCPNYIQGRELACVVCSR